MHSPISMTVMVNGEMQSNNPDMLLCPTTVKLDSIIKFLLAIFLFFSPNDNPSKTKKNTFYFI